MIVSLSKQTFLRSYLFIGFREGLWCADFLFGFWCLDFSFITFPPSTYTCSTGNYDAKLYFSFLQLVRVFKIILFVSSVYMVHLLVRLPIRNVLDSNCPTSGPIMLVILATLLLNLNGCENLQRCLLHQLPYTYNPHILVDLVHS